MGEGHLKQKVQASRAVPTQMTEIEDRSKGLREMSENHEVS